MSTQLNPAREGRRLPILDGWRACSILLVLAGHLLPIGPKSLALNEAVAAAGMVIFFILSGFLITRFLLADQDIGLFAVRRLSRIVPLAWVGMLAALAMAGADSQTYLANLLFYANWPDRLVIGGRHFWSLCVEMQFYLGIAILIGLAGVRGFLVIPALCAGVTLLRISAGSLIDMETWFRVDEILAGSCLALAYSGWFGQWPEKILSRINVYLLLPFIVLSGHPKFTALNYARPYIAMLAVGASLYNMPPLLRRLFNAPAMTYIATISYALYVIHGVLTFTWLGSGDTRVRYLKRPLLLAVTFGLAHLSTFKFEHPVMDYANSTYRKFRERRAVQPSR